MYKSEKSFWIGLTLVLSLLIIVLGFVYLKFEIRKANETKGQELEAIASLKSDQIANWIADEMFDAKSIAQNKILISRLELWRDEPTEENKHNVTAFLKTLKSEHGYEHIFITDEKGNFLISSDENDFSIAPFLQEKAKLSIQSHSVVTTDLYECPVHDTIHIDFIAPVTGQEPSLSAAIVFQFNPNKFLFPLIQSWPTLSKSSETLLYKVEGDSILFLNELKHKKNTALNFSLPLTDEEVVAVMAINSTQQGLIEGKDYAGNKVLGYVIEIPNTEWIMVSKTDKKELFSSLYYEMGIVILLVVFLLLFLAAGMAFLYNSRQKSIYRDLYKQQEYYFTTLKSIGDAVISTNKNGKVEYLNPVAEQLTGWLNKEAQGKSLEKVFKIINEESREAVESPVHKVLREGIVVGLANHTLLISKDGREIPIADSGAPIKNKKDEIVGVVLVFRDQTEEREYQKKLIQSEAKYREREFWLSESQKAGRIGSYDFDIPGNRWTSSETLDQIFGITSDNPRSLESWNAIIHPEHQKEMLDYFLVHVVKNRAPFDKEYKIIRQSDGSERWVLGRGELNFNEAAEPMRMYGTIMDITKRKQFEQQLQESEERFRKAVLLAPIPIMVHDEDAKVINISEGWTHFSGYTLEDIPDLKIWTEKAYGEKAKEVEEYVNGLFQENKTVFSGEFEIIAKSGEKRIWNFYTTPLGKLNSGKRIMLSMAPDVTQRKRVENELIEAKEKAEESERLKSAFLANMSHEIRTPLNGILGFTNLLCEDGNLSMENKKEYGFVINKSAEGLLKIINDILDISRLETGKTNIEQKPFDAAKALSTIYSIFQKKMVDTGKKDVNLVVQKPDVPLILNTDENRLIQIFFNLLDNALRFTSEGSVTFGISEIKENKAEFFVTDTGVGIPKEKHELIFDHFSQADNTTTRSYGGTGLGLSIVKKLLELMESEISVESEPGKGACFRFQLPVISIEKNEEQSIAEKPTGKIRFNNIKILVVEDDLTSQHYFRQILTSRTSNLYFAATGKETLQLFETQNPDVILMDIGLPDMNGLDVVRKIRETNTEVIIIAQTAYAMTEDRQKALEAECNGYIAKPVKSAELLEKISEFFN
jgi:PAS domain S-box-containing protein